MAFRAYPIVLAILVLGSLAAWLLPFGLSVAVSSPLPSLLPSLLSSSSEPLMVESRSWLSEIYTVDRKYGSMMGPFSQRELSLGEAGAPRELLWITGYRAVMVSADGETRVARDFMCHSNLDINSESHRQAFSTDLAFSPRLFTLSQGQFEIEFPAGFGIPLLSDEVLSLGTQVLNLNIEGKSFAVRHLVTVNFVRQSQLELPMKPLFPIGAYGLKLLAGDHAYFGITRPDGERHGPGCLVGKSASEHSYEDALGQTFTGHWVVEPGREVNRTLVTRLMLVPFATRVHYIAVHLHSFAESLELRDLTTGETLFRSSARGHEDRIGLAAVEHYSSSDGFAVYPDHEYELVSVYHNTSDQPQDSMAVMYMYLRDHEFESRYAVRQDFDQLLR